MILFTPGKTGKQNATKYKITKTRIYTCKQTYRQELKNKLWEQTGQEITDLMTEKKVCKWMLLLFAANTGHIEHYFKQHILCVIYLCFWQERNYSIIISTEFKLSMMPFKVIKFNGMHVYDECM